MDDVVKALMDRFGEDWAEDEEANLRFSLNVEHVLAAMEGVHLVGDPEMDEGKITVNVWVDQPIRDLMGADQLAYDIFGRISEELFFSERQFASASLRYRFVTGSQRHGHVGTLVLTGPHASDFADRHQLRLRGDVRFHA
jgi:hypothetical protein